MCESVLEELNKTAAMLVKARERQAKAVEATDVKEALRWTGEVRKLNKEKQQLRRQLQQARKKSSS